MTIATDLPRSTKRYAQRHRVTLNCTEVVAEIAAQNRRYEDAARFAATGVRLDEEYWRGHALLGINQLRLGNMAEGRASLDTAFRGDPFDIWTKNTLDLLDRAAHLRGASFSAFCLSRAGP